MSNILNSKVVIFIASEQKGFLIALADILERVHGLNTVIVARDIHVKNLVKKLLPNRKNDIVFSDVKVCIDESRAIDEAKSIEKKYNINIAMLLSEDRSFGQGYLTNIEKIPDIIRASWPHQKKLVHFLKDFKKKEKILTNVKFVIQMWPTKTVTTITKSLGVKSFSFVAIKYGDRMFWSDNDYITSSRYIDNLEKFLKKSQLSAVDYMIDSDADNVNKSVKYTYKDAIKQITSIVFNDTKNWVRKKQKKNSYHYLGWIPSVLRKVSNYNYILSKSVTPDDLSGYKVVYFALHLEPEVALLNFSPEFNNSMEAIIWISKSLPSDYILVVKEQALSYGIRSKWYYNQLTKIPNVMLAHPDIHSWNWIDKSDFVSTITGTVGQESIYFKKPVLSFGKHQIINNLPTVYFVSNYFETKKAISSIVDNYPTNQELEHAKKAFSHAQIKSSIDVKGYENTYGSLDLEINMARKALDNLLYEYPDIKRVL